MSVERNETVLGPTHKNQLKFLTPVVEYTDYSVHITRTKYRVPCLLGSVGIEAVGSESIHKAPVDRLPSRNGVTVVTRTLDRLADYVAHSGVYPDSRGRTRKKSHN